MEIRGKNIFLWVLLLSTLLIIGFLSIGVVVLRQKIIPKNQHELDLARASAFIKFDNDEFGYLEYLESERKLWKAKTHQSDVLLGCGKSIVDGVEVATGGGLAPSSNAFTIVNGELINVYFVGGFAQEINISVEVNGKREVVLNPNIRLTVMSSRLSRWENYKLKYLINKTNLLSLPEENPFKDGRLDASGVLIVVCRQGRRYAYKRYADDKNEWVIRQLQSFENKSKLKY